MFIESEGTDWKPYFSVYGEKKHQHFQWSHYIFTDVFEPDDEGMETLVIYMSNCQIHVKGKRFGKTSKKDDHGAPLTAPENMWKEHVLLSVNIDKIEDPTDAYVSGVHIILPD